MKSWIMAVALAAFTTLGTAQAQEALVGDAEAGKASAATCAGCHGLDGKALQPEYPNLAGQHASYLAKQLRNYRDKERENAIMYGMAVALSDQDIVNLAAYYGEQPRVPGVADTENLQAGEDIYRGGITSAGIASCTGCHGPAGLGNPAAVYPVLAGQSQQYTQLQLQAFRAGTRNNDPNAMMRNLSHRLSDSEISSVSNYIQGLAPAN